MYGYEIKEYLLEKWGRKCAYCGKENVPLEIEHIIPKSKGGSDRISNLTLACHECNQKKGNQSIEEFLANNPERLKQIKSVSKKPHYPKKHWIDAACVGEKVVKTFKLNQICKF